MRGQLCGKIDAVLRKTGKAMVQKCPWVSVVMGDVIDIGESDLVVFWFDIPFERVSKTTYPTQCHHPLNDGANDGTTQ